MLCAQYLFGNVDNGIARSIMAIIFLNTRIAHVHMYGLTVGHFNPISTGKRMSAILVTRDKHTSPLQSADVIKCGVVTMQSIVSHQTPHGTPAMMTSSNGNNKAARYCPFVREIHRWSVNCPHKGQWRWALLFSLICAWINGWVNNREAGDLRRHRAHYDVTVMARARFSPHYCTTGCHIMVYHIMTRYEFTLLYMHMLVDVCFVDYSYHRLLCSGTFQGLAWSRIYHMYKSLYYINIGFRDDMSIPLQRKSLGFNSCWPSDPLGERRSRSTVTQVMACYLTPSGAPSYFLNQFPFVIKFNVFTWEQFQVKCSGTWPVTFIHRLHFQNRCNISHDQWVTNQCPRSWSW